jgi:hypothetical protein
LLTGTPDGRAMATSNALDSLFITLFSSPCGLPQVICRSGGAIEQTDVGSSVLVLQRSYQSASTP